MFSQHKELLNIMSQVSRVSRSPICVTRDKYVVIFGPLSRIYNSLSHVRMAQEDKKEFSARGRRNRSDQDLRSEYGKYMMRFYHDNEDLDNPVSYEQISQLDIYCHETRYHLVLIEPKDKEGRSSIIGFGCIDSDNYISRIYIVPKYRRSGFGRHLLWELLDMKSCIDVDWDEIKQSQSNQCPSLIKAISATYTLKVHQSNESAIHLYKSQGFHFDSDKQDSEGYKNMSFHWPI